MEDKGSKAGGLAPSDLVEVLKGSIAPMLLVLLTSLITYWQGVDFNKLVGGYGGLVALAGLAVLNVVKETIQNGLSTLTTKEGWLRLGKGSLMALSGAVIAYGQTITTGGEVDPLKVALWSVVTNLLRKTATDTTPKE
jgi:hypothetical protein